MNTDGSDNVHINVDDPSPASPATILPVGDNTVSQTQSKNNTEEPRAGDSIRTGNTFIKPPSYPDQHWLQAIHELKGMATQTCQELKVIGTKLNKLDKIELSTENLAQQMSGVLQRTITLEGRMDQSAETILQLKQEVQSLQSTVVKQEATIADLQLIKQEFTRVNEEFTQTSLDKVEEFNKLIGLQQSQVDAFHETNKKIQDAIQDNVTQHIDEKMDKWSDIYDYNSLKDKAQRNKNNLVIIGHEEEDKHPRSTAQHFISSTMGLKNVEVDEAYRLGQPPPEGSTYARPILMSFTKMSHRNKVWKGKKVFTSEDEQRKIRIQQDLPKRLREDSQILHRVLKQASTLSKFRSAKIVDYKLRLHGKYYTADRLESLPKPLRPSTLASKSSDSTLVFFTRYSILSNHHHAPFTLKGVHYANIEHYLAYQRALKGDDEQIIQRAREAADPLEAKSILNLLKKDHQQEWDEDVEHILTMGLREKFKQNPKLLKYLSDTQQLQLGEASRDPKWGIGMSLDDEQVLDTSKWLPNGNLLGRTLSKVRNELCPLTQSGNQPSTHESSPSHNTPAVSQDTSQDTTMSNNSLPSEQPETAPLETTVSITSVPKDQNSKGSSEVRSNEPTSPPDSATEEIPNRPTSPEEISAEDVGIDHAKNTKKPKKKKNKDKTTSPSNQQGSSKSTPPRQNNEAKPTNKNGDNTNDSENKQPEKKRPSQNGKPSRQKRKK